MFEDQDLVNYVKVIANGEVSHECYDESVSHANDMGIHVFGNTPDELLKKYRPNETDAIHEYRLSMYEPTTKSSFQKVLNAFYRIFNERLYSIKFGEVPARILQDESPEMYITEDFPVFGDLMLYFRDVVFQKMLADPNAVVLMMPTSPEIQDGDFYNPFPFLYCSEQVVDMVPGKYFTLLLEEKSIVEEASGKKVMEGEVYFIVDSSAVYKVVQTGKKADRKFNLSTYWKHDYGKLPARRLGGLVEETKFPFCFKSFTSGILPFWNKAIRIDSDLDASYVQHLYPERVEIEIECDDCEDGRVIMEDGKSKKCRTCGGSGTISTRTPYGKRVIKSEAVGAGETIFPGVEYVKKPTEIVEITEKKVEKLIEKGFAALNMEHLQNVGENQTGRAKEIDRQDFDAMLLRVSNATFALIKWTIKWTIRIRYSTIMATDSVSQLFPEVVRPQNFNTISVNELTSEIASAKASNVNQSYINGLELDAIRKRFGDHSMIAKMAELSLKLDPFSGKTEEEKFTMLAQQGISKRDYILSSNLKRIIQIAHQNHEELFSMTPEEQRAVIDHVLEEFVEKIDRVIDTGIPVE